MSGFSIIEGRPVGGENSFECGVAERDAGLSLGRRLRALLPGAFLIGSSGIIEPRDALAYLRDCNLVQVHSGLVISGPGLSKRINEAIVYERLKKRSEQPGERFLSSGWVAMAGLGLGLIVCSITSFVVGVSEIILPYDEEFIGVTRQGLNACNEHILQFMSHDRVTYSGTGLSTGILYLLLALFGAFRRDKWIFQSLMVSSTVGFLSFLLFLGYHYFDKLHAVVMLLLLPPFIWAVFKVPKFQCSGSANLANSRAWRFSLYGQLLFVLIGCGLMLAGSTISMIGISTVFVPEDLQFMQTSVADIKGISERLVPVIAHDRAGFGGGLLANGLLVLCIALYGFKPCSGMLWWMLLIAGLCGFVPVIAIHWYVGYMNVWHLAPVYLAMVWFIAGLRLSWSYMNGAGD